MQAVRAFFRNHRGWAIWLIAVSLALKALVPAGYMIGAQASVLTVQICSDPAGDHPVRQIDISKTGDSGDGHTQPGKASAACPFSLLPVATEAGMDAALLAIGLLFVLALGFAPASVPAVAQLAYLRPPLRGPPILI